jgi:hypothetical protein
MDNEEILKEVKKIILEAAAIRVLYSDDIDIIILDKAFKDRAYGLPLTEKLKIYKKDYFIKVSNIPLSVHVVCEKKADNIYLITAICEASRTVFFSL